jgi:hypothetical protein
VYAVPTVPPGRLVVVIVIAGIRAMVAEADLVASATLLAVSVTELADEIVVGTV